MTRTPFPFRLAAIDIDDTLVGHDKRISEANRAAVNRLKELGCRVVLASGRRHDNVVPFHRDLGLEGFVVSSQGAVARGVETDEVLHAAPLPPAHAAEVTADGLARGLTVMVWTAGGVFTLRRTEWVERYVADSGDDEISMADVVALAGGGTPVEKVIWGADPATITRLAHETRRRYRAGVLMTVTEDWFLEFNAPAATKATAVAAVAKHYGVEPAGVLAFGDGNNDVPMLQWAGMGVAMPPGRPGAHAAARLVARPGDPETALARAVDDVIEAVGQFAERRASGAAA